MNMTDFPSPYTAISSIYSSLEDMNKQAKVPPTSSESQKGLADLAHEFLKLFFFDTVFKSDLLSILFYYL